MKHFIYQLSLISYLLCTSCCTPEEDPLAACKADPNCEYFECLVDGEKWVANCEAGPIFGCKAIDSQYYKDIGWLILSIENSSLSQSILLYVEGKLEKNKSYTIYGNSKSPSLLGNSKVNNTCDIYKIDTLKMSSFETIFIDTINNKIEAKFNFIVKNECNDSKEITTGILRTKYRF